MTNPAPITPGPAAAALACAARGWHVFPLRPRDKRPLARFTDWETHATTDPNRIRAFWGRGPAFNVAIACGPSGLVVIDLDTPKPDETPPRQWAMPGVNEGADVLAVLCERHGERFPAETFAVTTRRGGMHLYFTAPPGVELRNTAGRNRTGLGWLIDTRATGGYVVAPGSHVDLPDGTGPYRVVNNVPPAPLPAWLARLLTPTTAPTPVLGAKNEAGEVADLPAYVQAALKGETERVTAAMTGGRNHALNKAAYNLGRLAATGALDPDLAGSVLYDAATVHFSTGPNAFTPADARATIRSALAAGARKPRTITEGNAA
ncbi:bifunctional DNA primase/polymerase [Spirillospora sp. NPDC048911]|uniref:bifunctional DNA primase/polymerase n=1 Tax=Spirillospora sp. NPDC048911 TaxID=3364527 RepID=UPI003718B542